MGWMGRRQGGHANEGPVGVLFKLVSFYSISSLELTFASVSDIRGTACNMLAILLAI